MPCRSARLIDILDSRQPSSNMARAVFRHMVVRNRCTCYSPNVCQVGGLLKVTSECVESVLLFLGTQYSRDRARVRVWGLTAVVCRSLLAARRR